MQRPGAFPYAKPVRQWKMPEVYREFLTALSQPVNGGGVPEFLRVMAMGRTYGPENLEQAMRQALSENIVDAERVRQLVSRGSYPVSVSKNAEKRRTGKKPIARSESFLFDCEPQGAFIFLLEFFCYNLPHHELIVYKLIIC